MQTSNRMSRWWRDIFHYKWNAINTARLQIEQNIKAFRAQREWVWWLGATDDTVTAKDKTWLIGLFHESSNRMKKWSRNPMAGSIAIPFAIANATDSGKVLHIKTEHLVYGNFREAEMKNIPVPENNISPSEKTVQIDFEISKTVTLYAAIEFSDVLNTGALKYWFSDLSYDNDGNILSGYFHFAASVDDLYTTRITFSDN